jgi:hypothetical protein
VYKVIDFYEPVNPQDELCLEQGCFWWACTPYVFNKPVITRFFFDRPTESLNLANFDARKEAPDERAETEPGEFLAISKFKRRPVIILSTSGTPYRDRAWYGGEFFLVAPTRTLRNEITGEYKANPDFVWDSITYQYSSVFYLPEDSAYDFLEAVLQFDRMTTLHRSWLLEPRRAKLSQDARVCVNAWLQNYIFGKIPNIFNENLNAYRAMVGEDPQVRAGLFGHSGI